jgi:hypothetical protein
LEAISWQPNWRDLATHDRPAFASRVAHAVVVNAWVVEGNCSPVRDLIWLDYDRPVVMVRVIRRLLRRAGLRTELWGGNRERWRRLLLPSYLICWAWSTCQGRRQETTERLKRPGYAAPTVLRVHHPRQLRQTIQQRLAGACVR